MSMRFNNKFYLLLLAKFIALYRSIQIRNPFAIFSARDKFIVPRNFVDPTSKKSICRPCLQNNPLTTIQRDPHCENLLLENTSELNGQSVLEKII